MSITRRKRRFQTTCLAAGHAAMRTWNCVSWGRPELASGPFRRIVRNGEGHTVSGDVAELLARCRTAGLALLVEDDSLHVDFESDPPVDLIEEIRRHKPEVMAALSSAPLETAEVIAPACWVTGAAGNSFEMPCSERRGLIERVHGVFLHFCVECGRWGTYGYGATGEKPGRWYCHLHRPYE